MFEGVDSAVNRHGMRADTYTFVDVPEAHPIAILNQTATGGNIAYSVVDNTPIVIKVSGGQFNQNNSGDYYDFTNEAGQSIGLANGSFNFMRGRTYRFEADGVSGTHPFKIFVDGAFVSNTGITGSTGSIEFTIPSDHSTSPTDMYYQCGSHQAMSGGLHTLVREVNETNEPGNGTYDFYYGDCLLYTSDAADE